MTDGDFIDSEIRKQKLEYESKQIKKSLELNHAEPLDSIDLCIRCKKNVCKLSLCSDCIIEMSYNGYLGTYTNT